MEYTNFNGFLALLSANTLLPLALIIPPSTLSHTKLAVAFLPLIWSCNAFAWKCNLGFFAAAHAFLSTNFLLFRRPREDFKLLRLKSPAQSQASARKVDEKDNENAEEKESPIFKEPYPNTFWKRLWWVNKLVNSLRYVGWDTGEDKPPAVLPSPETWTAKGCWLVRKAVFIAICFAVFDATNFYQHFDPYFQSGTDIDEQLPRRLATFLSRCYLHFLSPRAVRILIVGVQQYVIFSVMGIILAIPPILLGGLGILDDFWSGTYNWQPIMGNPLVVLDSGLRGFWGKFWHQLFRSIFVGLGKALATLLGVPGKSLAAYAMQVLIAFGISGALHAATLPVGLEGVSPMRYASFFWIQGTLVVFEVLVSHIAKAVIAAEVQARGMRVGLLMVMRLVWVVRTFYYTAPIIVDELTKVSRAIRKRPVFLFTLPAI